MRLLTLPNPRAQSLRLIALAALTSLAIPGLMVVPSSASAGVTPLAPASTAQVFTSVPGGPVVLDGNDPADHPGAADAYIRRVYSSLDANAAAGYVHNGQVAVIGTCAPMLRTLSTGETFVQFDTAAAVEGLFSNIGANNYKHIHICSDDDNTLSPSVQAELDTWGSALASHVNRGGGLFATGHKFNWLTSLFPSLVVTYGGTGSSYVTTDGATMLNLPANTLVNSINHYTFTGDASTPLKPLLTASQNGVGLRVAIGGTTVRFPQISLTGVDRSEVGTNETYTLTAATADGVLLSNNAFTYTVTGASSSPASGSGVTDANGQYFFTFTGTARGKTTLRVTMALGGGTAAGAVAFTTWASSTDAPTGTVAQTVVGQPGSTQVSWVAPVNHGSTPISDYVIQRTTDGGTTWVTVADGLSTSTSTVVTGLDPAVSYTFRVAAVNGDGQGPGWSPLAADNAIQFPQPDDVALDAGPVTLTATSTSGLPESYTTATTAVCTVVDDTVTLLTPGTCTITADQAGGGIYSAAQPVTRSFPVTAPALVVTPVTSTGPGGDNQQVTIPVPSGGSVVFLDTNGQPTTTLTVPGEGAYTVDSATGAVTFTPLASFSGTASSITYRVTDVYGQVATSLLTPTVVAQAVTAPPVTSTGPGGANQQVTLPVPSGGSVAFVDADGNLTTTLTVPGVGTYTVDPVTGVANFTPLASFEGQAPPVTYRVTDIYGQIATGIFTPTVVVKTAVVTPSDSDASVRIGDGSATIALRADGSVPVTCKVEGATVARCSVVIYATVDDQRVVVGRGSVVYPAGAEPQKAIVIMHLNAKGKALTATPGGRRLRAVATVTPTGATQTVTARATAMVVAKTVLVARPIFFTPASATIRPRGLDYLIRLRHKIGAVDVVTCTGYTDWNGTGQANIRLGMRRAKVVCDFLTKGTRIDTRLITKGETQPHADNTSVTGRTLNRRTTITLGY